MAKTADTIAIYSRKSRYTGKGESIGNQIDLCREYIRSHYGDAAAEKDAYQYFVDNEAELFAPESDFDGIPAQSQEKGQAILHKL